MTFYLCVSGCGRYLEPGDGHERCIACLGLVHAEAAFVDESCTHCGKMTISELRSRLQLLQRGGVPVPLPRSNPPQRVAASGGTGDLRITVSALPSGNQPPRNTCTPQPVELPGERGGPSQRCAPSVSFGAPPDDRMSIAASEGESDFSGDDASAQLPPSGTVAVPDTDLCLLQRPAEGKGCLQAEDGPLDSGRHRLGLPSTRHALPAQVACPLYERRGILLGVGSCVTLRGSHMCYSTGCS